MYPWDYFCLNCPILIDVAPVWNAPENNLWRDKNEYTSWLDNFDDDNHMLYCQCNCDT